MAGKRKRIPRQNKVKETKLAKPSIATNICPKHFFAEDELKIVQTNLLEWYDSEQRTLPWRDIAKVEKDPNIRGYSVWVSEVMLQQTQVATVIPFFNKWMKQWPTVVSLAKADLEDVMRTWSGLGYYSRGRRLHEGAKIVMEKLDGRIPDMVPDLIKLLPGIGRYSASAIASVAFQRVVGVVDGNVVRVFSRMRSVGAPFSQSTVCEHFWELANGVVSPTRPGDFNQALMELGATVCTPQNPNCSKCPVSNNCNAYLMTKSDPKVGSMDSFIKKENINPPVIENNPKVGSMHSCIKTENVDLPDIEDIVDCQFCLPASTWNENPQVTAFPCKVEKKRARQEKVSVLVIEQNGNFLVTRRPDKGLLAGLWEFPSCLASDESPEGIKSTIKSILKEFGLSISLLSSRKSVGEVVHLFSHIHTTYVVEHLLLGSSVKTKCPKKETMWLNQEEFKSAAVSTAMKKVLALVKKSESSPKKDTNSKKRKLSADNSKQPSIKSFFK